MGIVVLQLGQAGNQFGSSFFNALAGLSPSIHLPLEFFKEVSEGLPTARAVLVDMEHKVIAALNKRASAKQKWRYGVKNSFTQDSGSGNNWARGFYRHGPQCGDAILDLIRKEAEACDLLGGFLTMQSIAGGTGSGLGAYLLEIIKDEYPHSPIFSHCMWPFDSGEVVVQSYNILLSISHLQELADGIIHVRNEALMAICKKMLAIQRPSFDDMNQVAAQAMACMFLPAYGRPIEHPSSSSMGPRLRLLSDFVAAVCSDPSYRMLALRFIPQIPSKHIDFTTFKWESQLKQLRRMLYIDAPTNYTNVEGTIHRSVDRCVSNLLVLRGKNSFDADASIFTQKALYPIWSVDRLTVGVHPACFGKYDMAAGLLSNCQSSIIHASQALSRARALYSAKAYVFQYFQNGMEEKVLEDSFVSFQDVLDRYNSL